MIQFTFIQDGEQAACRAGEVYSRSCKENGVSPGAWRTWDFCCESAIPGPVLVYLYSCGVPCRTGVPLLWTCRAEHLLRPGVGAGGAGGAGGAATISAAGAGRRWSLCRRVLLSSGQSDVEGLVQDPGKPPIAIFVDHTRPGHVPVPAPGPGVHCRPGGRPGLQHLVSTAPMSASAPTECLHHFLSSSKV